jgi:hypothetical protein
MRRGDDTTVTRIRLSIGVLLGQLTVLVERVGGRRATGEIAAAARKRRAFALCRVPDTSPLAGRLGVERSVLADVTATAVPDSSRLG